MTVHRPSPYETPSHGMLDDAYWGQFTSDSNDYELGHTIGFGASSTVYSAVFTVPLPIFPIPTRSTITSLPPHTDGDHGDTRTTKNTPNLSIDIDIPRSGLGGSDDEGAERVCAVKVSTSHPDVDLLFKETRLLTLCRHPNVLRILATFTLPPDHARIAIVTPLISGGSLAGVLDWRSRLITTPKVHHFPSFRIGHRKKEEDQDFLSSTGGKGRLDEEEIKGVVKQVLEGLEYLHGNGFLHRDLKAGNLLIAHDGTILLADFGVGGDLNQPPSPVRSRKSRLPADQLRFGNGSMAEPATLGPGVQAGRQKTLEFVGGSELAKKKSFVGTPNWMAPEVVMGQKYDTKADIWSLGITILELAHGAVPGFRDKADVVLAHIVTDAPPTLDRSVGGFSKHMKDFVDVCLNKDPKTRPTASHLLEHHWLKGVKKRSWLANALLADVPPLAQRQELRRIPTMSSFVSRASSWDFSNTPSMPSSPIRTSLLIASARSPSLSSHLADSFPTVGRTHSRGSSFSASIGPASGGVPPSPRVSLRQWAERNGNPEDWGGSLSIRTGSERGKRRSLSSAGLRRGKSASFDVRPSAVRTSQDGRSAPGEGPSKGEEASRSRVLAGHSPPPSPVRTKREVKFPTTAEEALIGGGVDGAKTDKGGMAPMSPLLEATRSRTDGQGEKSPPTEGLLGLGIDSMHGEYDQVGVGGRGLSESPEKLLELPQRMDGVIFPIGDGSEHLDRAKRGDITDHLGPRPSMSFGPTAVPPNAHQSIVPVIPTTLPWSATNGPEEETKVAVPNHSSPIHLNKSNGEIPDDPPRAAKPALAPIHHSQDREREKEKRHWLGRKGSTKQGAKGTPSGIASTSTTREKERVTSTPSTSTPGADAGSQSQSMGRTASWTGVLGRVANKIHKR